MSTEVGPAREDALRVAYRAREAFDENIHFPGITLGAEVSAFRRVNHSVDRSGNVVGFSYREGIRDGGDVCDVGFYPSALTNPQVRLVAGWATHVCAINELTQSAVALESSGALIAAAAASRASLEMSARLVECCARLEPGDGPSTAHERLVAASAWLYEPGDAPLTGPLIHACAAACDAAERQAGEQFGSLYPALCSITHPGDAHALAYAEKSTSVLMSVAASMAAAGASRACLQGALGETSEWDCHPTIVGARAMVVVSHPPDRRTAVPITPDRVLGDLELERALLDDDHAQVTAIGFEALTSVPTGSPFLAEAVAGWSELAGYAIAMVNRGRLATAAVLTRFAWEHALAAHRIIDDSRNDAPRVAWSDSQKKKWRLGEQSQPKVTAMISASTLWRFNDGAGENVTAGVALTKDIVTLLNQMTHPDFIARVAYLQRFTATRSTMGKRVLLANGEFGTSELARVPGEPATIAVVLGDDGRQVDLAYPEFPRHPANPFASTSMPTVALVLLMETAVRMVDVSR